MILSAGQLSAFQRCPIQWLRNSQSKETRRWRPKSLLANCLRSAIFALSNGADLDRTISEAVAQFMEKAARPGLDIHGKQVFTLARDFASMLKTVLSAVYSSLPMGLGRSPAVLVSESLKWAPGAFVDESNTLHSWITVDALSDAVLSREMHGWNVYGDMAATGWPMVLHVIEIGRQSGDHQNSPWCKCYAHSHVMNRWAFQSKDGSPLRGNWKPIWFQDGLRNNPHTWIQTMERDNVRLLKDVPLEAIPQYHERFKREVIIEAARMAAMIANPSMEPMRRTSCDSPLCVWQNTCYGKAPETVDSGALVSIAAASSATS